MSFFPKISMCCGRALTLVFGCLVCPDICKPFLHHRGFDFREKSTSLIYRVRANSC